MAQWPLPAVCLSDTLSFIVFILSGIVVVVVGNTLIAHLREIPEILEVFFSLRLIFSYLIERVCSFQFRFISVRVIVFCKNTRWAEVKSRCCQINITVW